MPRVYQDRLDTPILSSLIRAASHTQVSPFLNMSSEWLVSPKSLSRLHRWMAPPQSDPPHPGASPLAPGPLPPPRPPEETKPVAETEKPVPPHHHRAIRDISRRPSTLATTTNLDVYHERPSLRDKNAMIPFLPVY